MYYPKPIVDASHFEAQIIGQSITIWGGRKRILDEEPQHCKLVRQRKMFDRISLLSRSSSNRQLRWLRRRWTERGCMASSNNHVGRWMVWLRSWSRSCRRKRLPTCSKGRNINSPTSLSEISIVLNSRLHGRRQTRNSRCLHHHHIADLFIRFHNGRVAM